MDYKLLLKKYMRLIHYEEGIYYLEGQEKDAGLFSNAEIEILKKISNEPDPEKRAG